MATYADRPLVPFAVCAPALAARSGSGELQNSKGAELETLIAKIVQHWATLDIQYGHSVADVPYEPMPPIAKYRFIINLRVNGVGVPMPYEFDDIDE